MADLTAEVPITQEWTIVSGNLADGSTYALDVIATSAAAKVYWALTDNADPPSADITGHPIGIGSRDSKDSRQLNKNANETSWMRCDRGAAKIVLTKV